MGFSVFFLLPLLHQGPVLRTLQKCEGRLQGKKEERNRLMQRCQTVPLKFSRSGLGLCTHTHTHTHTHKHSDITHTRQRTSDWLVPNWGGPLSSSSSLLFPLVWWSFFASSALIYLEVVCVCVWPVSVFSGWDAESQCGPSVFRTHSPFCFSPHFFPFSPPD